MAGMAILRRIRKTALISFLLSVVIHIGSSFVVKRDGEPYFKKTPTNITVHEGELAVLKCHIERLGPKMVNVVVWRKMSDDYPLTIGKMTFSPEDEITIDHSQHSKSSSTWDLLIKNVKPYHAGTYECQVSANHLIAQYVTLNVLERSKMRSELRITGNTIVNIGSKIHLICNASGVLRAPEAVDWFFEGNRIHQSNSRWRGRIEILKHTSIEGRYFISELIIDQSRMEDDGSYVCRSSDLDAHYIKIHVLNNDKKDNLTRRDTEKDQQIQKAPGSEAVYTRQNMLPVLTFAIIALVWR